MITRAAIDVQIFVLRLNPVTGHTQDLNHVAVSTDYDKLVDWYKEQLAPEKYRDENDPVRNMLGGIITKSFQHGSPLEYYNPCNTTDLQERMEWGGGIVGEWFREEVAMNILDGRGGGGYTVVCRD